MRNHTEKPLAIRNGLKIYKPLRAKTPMNKVSKKQSVKNKELLKNRKLILSNICEKCGQKADWRGIQTHHIKHRSQGGNNELENLILLCARCHNLAHGIREC